MKKRLVYLALSVLTGMQLAVFVFHVEQPLEASMLEKPATEFALKPQSQEVETYKKFEPEGSLLSPTMQVDSAELATLAMFKKSVDDSKDVAYSVVNGSTSYTLGVPILTTEQEKIYSEKVNEINLRIHSGDTIQAVNDFRDWCADFKVDIATTVSHKESTILMPPSLKDMYLTYEPYTAITRKTSMNYKLSNLYAKTDEEGYRKYKGATLVALGSAYGTEIGMLYNIHFDSGKVLYAILGDGKADEDTDSTNRYADGTYAFNGIRGNVVEIIFDTNFGEYASMGKNEKMLAINKKINSDYPGNVVLIEKLGMAEGLE